ncbi:hypothetical protein [Streptococcus equi]|uniref:hypothetical protein n=1 Tax=Streptococcus equi TaxID=1336 RepID=UPI0018A22D82|nr:hypothetical protein [Streptococcus equi]HEL1142856.1 hypothetical protein [Streptococcus equi subsp. zooepidemicus]
MPPIKDQKSGIGLSQIFDMPLRDKAIDFRREALAAGAATKKQHKQLLLMVCSSPYL